MLEIVDGAIVGQITHRGALYFNGREIAFCTLFESYAEALTWGQNEWASLQERLGMDELNRLSWTIPELRCWT